MSLDQGLYLPGTSKINVDIQPVLDDDHPDFLQSERVLHLLTSHIQKETISTVQNPILVWHRTASRPWMLLFAWEGIPVHVTYRNTPTQGD